MWAVGWTEDMDYKFFDIQFGVYTVSSILTGKITVLNLKTHSCYVYHNYVTMSITDYAKLLH